MAHNYLAQSLSITASQYAVRVMIGSILAVFVLMWVASYAHHRYHFTKKAFYGVLATIVASTTTVLLIININLLAASSSNSIERRSGHIVFDICKQQVPIRSGQLFSDSVGNGRQKIFENNRIEYNGYVTDVPADLSLGAFIQAAGGTLSSNVLTLPYSKEVESELAGSAILAQFSRTNPMGERYLELQSGTSCDVYPSMLSVFVYRYNESTDSYTQERLSQPDRYVLSPQSIENGDCIVVIFGDPSEKTTLRCGDYPDADKITPAGVRGTI